MNSLIVAADEEPGRGRSDTSAPQTNRQERLDAVTPFLPRGASSAPGTGPPAGDPRRFSRDRAGKAWRQRPAELAHPCSGRFRSTGVPAYAYELRRGDHVITTGHMKQEDPLVVGDRVVIGEHRGIVHTVSTQMVSGDLRLVVQLMPT